MGRTQGWVSKVENGRVELDRAGIINQLAAVLHCHPNDLIERPYVAGKASENQWQVSAAAILRELRRYDLRRSSTDGRARPWSCGRRRFGCTAYVMAPRTSPS